MVNNGYRTDLQTIELLRMHTKLIVTEEVAPRIAFVSMVPDMSYTSARWNRKTQCHETVDRFEEKFWEVLHPRHKHLVIRKSRNYFSLFLSKSVSEIQRALRQANG